MTISAGYSTPLLHVSEIERSIRFYELLGFQTVDTDRAQPLGWARLHCEGGAVMFLRAEEPVDQCARCFMLYLYTADLVALRAHLMENGITVPPIQTPVYMPSGEVTISDPDGYRVFVGHWGDGEHQAWLRRIGKQ